MALTSVSTDAEVLAQYEDNVLAADSYDTAAAVLALQALRYIRIRLPQSGTFAGRAFTMAALDAEIKRFEQIATYDQFRGMSAGGRVIYRRLDGRGGMS
jgi:hypothetical protein